LPDVVGYQRGPRTAAGMFGDERSASASIAIGDTSD
jgi:hypothetical protein